MGNKGEIKETRALMRKSLSAQTGNQSAILSELGRF